MQEARSRTKNRLERARRVLAPEIAQLGSAPQTFSLSPEQRKHLKTVLRVEDGAPLEIADGAGKLFSGHLHYQGSDAAVSLESVLETAVKPPGMTLCIGMPKNSTMDWIVEKATECGASRIIPIISSRSIVRPRSDELSKYVRRWQSIVDGAVEQSERLWRPEVASPEAWDGWLRTRPKSITLFAFFSEDREENLALTWKNLVDTWKKNGTGDVQILIGPEGGFSQDERKALLAAGVIPCSLGKTILRVETAVIAALTLVQASRSCFGTISL